MYKDDLKVKKVDKEVTFFFETPNLFKKTSYLF